MFKSDNMKLFAAKASAECLIAFLRENLPPADLRDLSILPGTQVAGTKTQLPREALSSPVASPEPPSAPLLRLNDDFQLEFDDLELRCFNGDEEC
jgi:hypothetical protein